MYLILLDLQFPNVSDSIGLFSILLLLLFFLPLPSFFILLFIFCYIIFLKSVLLFYSMSKVEKSPGVP